MVHRIYFAVIVAMGSEVPHVAAAPAETEVGETTIRLTYPSSIVKRTAWADALSSETFAAIHFDHDVLINDNRLAAGKYVVQILDTDSEFVRIAFGGPHDVDGASAEPERLELAIEPDENDYRRRFRMALTDIELPEFDEEEDEDEWGGASAELQIAWADREIFLFLETTGMRRHATPVPPMQGDIKAAWEKVQASLDGLVEQDLDKHIAPFDTHFQSDFEDGGSAEAHAQLLGHRLRSGGLDGTLLDLERVTWENEDESIEFRNVIVHTSDEMLNFLYEVKELDGEWRVIYLDAE